MTTEPTPTIKQRATTAALSLWTYATGSAVRIVATVVILLFLYLAITGRMSSCVSSCKDAAFDEAKAERKETDAATKADVDQINGRLDQLQVQTKQAVDIATATREDLATKDQADVEQQQRTGSARKNYRETTKRPATSGPPVTNDRIERALQP